MTNRERARKHLKEHKYAHIIYGYRAKGKDFETGFEPDMKKFYEDETFCSYVDEMQSNIDGLEMIFAVHG